MHLDELQVHILLVLTEGDLHGYAIAKQIERRGGPAVYPANLYRHLAALARQGLVQALPAALDDAGRARKAFRITPEGVAAVREQGERLRSLVDALEARQILSPRS